MQLSSQDGSAAYRRQASLPLTLSPWCLPWLDERGALLHFPHTGWTWLRKGSVAVLLSCSLWSPLALEEGWKAQCASYQVGWGVSSLENCRQDTELSPESWASWWGGEIQWVNKKKKASQVCLTGEKMWAFFLLLIIKHFVDIKTHRATLGPCLHPVQRS